MDNKWQGRLGGNNGTRTRYRNKTRHTPGTLESDSKIPLYSNAEFAAAAPLVSLQVDIHTTLDKRTNTVIVDSEAIPLREARRREMELEAEFRRVVTEETLKKKPDANERDIAIRMFDIRKSIESTNHISATYTGGHDGRC